MIVIDAQLHEPAVTMTWDRADDQTRRDVLTELQIGYMRAVGVDGALLFPVDLAWGEDAAARHPDRFAVVPMITAGGAFGGIDASAPDLEDTVAAKRGTPGVVAMRIVRTVPSPDGGAVLVPPEVFDRAVTACARADLPIFMSTVGDLRTPGDIAERHPDLPVIVDHLGLPQPPSYQHDSPPFRDLERLLALAVHPNVMVKVSGVPTLSEGAFPFADLWPRLDRILDVFGAERTMWGSDISRVMGQAGFALRFPRGEGPYPGKHCYADALAYLRDSDRLGDSDKALLLGGTASRVLGWQPATSARLDRPAPTAVRSTGQGGGR